MRDWIVPATGRVVLVSLARGDDFLQSIQAALAHSGVRSGVVLSAVATLAHCRLHQVQSADDVEDQRILELDGPLELTSASGVVANGEAHLHATVADRAGHAYGGHLEPDCPVLFLAEVSVLAVDAPGMARTRGADGIARLHN